ncbi:MAG: homoserine kinase [Actinobacteria bacterium]|nr:homoserine kinase [Actinomycetota bacterium]
MTSAPALGVEVPASSANLGPGFDALAVALDLSLSVWTVPRGDRRVRTEGEGADELPPGDDNLIWRSLMAYCDWAGAPAPDVSLRVRNRIPLERGLGSSAAATVAGLALGRALVGGAGDARLLALAAGIEGHPDNVAAALLGGLVVCADGRATRCEPTQRLRPLLCVPPARSSTAHSRGLVPATVATADAAANGARAALVLSGLAGLVAWDPRAMVDVLHEPARCEAMADSGTLVRALRRGGLGACLSGAGPAVLAVAPRGDDRAVSLVRGHLTDGWRLVPLDWALAGARVSAAATG